MSAKTLLIRHLPEDFTSENCNDFFKRFGALRVRYMGKNGKMKHTAFALFSNENEARIALMHLHQLKILNHRLVVEYSDAGFIEELPKHPMPQMIKNGVGMFPFEQTAHQQIDSQRSEMRKKISKEINSISSYFNFEYPFNPKLLYSYPRPTVTILTNIINALASVPKFYTQVLHLMNKMNLPAPFGMPTPTPPIFDDTQINQTKKVSDTVQLSEESEIESETENNDRINSNKKRKNKLDQELLTRKKIKLQLTMDAQMQALNKINSKIQSSKVTVKEVFEESEKSNKPKKFDFKITNDENLITLNVVNQNNMENKDTSQNEGFGKLEPTIEPVQRQNETIEFEWDVDDFITKDEIIKNRLSKDEYNQVKVFKNYNPGERSSRLYVKNLSKSITERDLHLIFGSFIDWTSQNERIIYDIRLMREGRMKGQAFITFPSEKQAEEALLLINGYKLLDRPMAIYFARSAKPKQI